MKAIIARWGNKNKSPNNYILRYWKTAYLPLRQYELIQNFVSFINDWMKRILKNFGIDKKLLLMLPDILFRQFLNVQEQAGNLFRKLLDIVIRKQKKTIQTVSTKRPRRNLFTILALSKRFSNQKRICSIDYLINKVMARTKNNLLWIKNVKDLYNDFFFLMEQSGKDVSIEIRSLMSNVPPFYYEVFG